MADVIQSMWVGSPLSAMEKLCIKSFLENGHPFHLYCYEPLEGVPEGTTIKNAAEILPQAETGNFRTIQQFADYFRYLLLYERGGWWMDMDTVCLRPFEFKQDYVFAKAPSTRPLVYNGFVKVPPKSQVMLKCIQLIQTMDAYSRSVADFQGMGPHMLTRLVQELDLTKHVLDGDTFDPVHWDKLHLLIDPEFKPDLSKSYTLHLFHAAWDDGPEAHGRKLYSAQHYPAGCIYENLKRRYLSPPRVSIVITTRDRATLLRGTLESIRAQAFKDYEVIVVDDGTDAETPALCKEFSTEYIHVGRAGVYRNPAQPINIGLRRATGDVVILQNAECKHIDPNTIERLSSAVSDRNVVFANVMGLKQDGSPDWLYCGQKAQRPFFFCGALKRATFERLRGMDEDYPCGGYDDNDFADRLKHEGILPVYTDISVHHQWHARPALNAEAAARVYVAKTADMAAGKISAVRNLGREWGALEPLTVATVGLPKVSNWNGRSYNYGPDGMTCDWHDRHRVTRRNS